MCEVSWVKGWIDDEQYGQNKRMSKTFLNQKNDLKTMGSIDLRFREFRDQK